MMKGHADREEAIYMKAQGDPLEEGIGSPGLNIPPEDITERIPVSHFLSMIALSMGMVPSIIDVWGYDRQFCSSSSSSSSTSITKKT